jgi:hypothetical protein
LEYYPKPNREIPGSPTAHGVIASAAKQSIFFGDAIGKDGLLRRLHRLAMTILNRPVFQSLALDKPVKEQLYRQQ